MIFDIRCLTKLSPKLFVKKCFKCNLFYFEGDILILVVINLVQVDVLPRFQSNLCFFFFFLNDTFVLQTDNYSLE